MGGLRRVLLYAGVWGVLLSGFYFGFWRPRLERLKQLQGQMVTQQSVINQLKRDVETYPKTITAETLGAVEEDLEKLIARIPAKEELPAVLKQIRQTAQHSGLEIIAITSVSQQQKRENQTLTIPSLTYQVTAEGDARNVLELFHSLEGGVRLVAVEEFSLRRINEDEHSVRADFAIKIFHSDNKALTSGHER